MPIGARYKIPIREFYQLNPKLLMRYRPYLDESLRYGMEDTHIAGWVFGQYISHSIGINFSKRAKYPNTPYYMVATQSGDDGEGHALTDADKFEAFMIAFNATHKDIPDNIVAEEVIDVTDSSLN